MRYLPYVLLFLAIPSMATDVWKWRDANGTLHFSDHPIQGAQAVNPFRPSSSVPAPSTQSVATSASSSSSTAVTYTNVEIWKPSAEMTLSNTAGRVNVAVRVEPTLNSEHHLALYLDGQLVTGFPQQGMEYEISDVERGAHTLTLAVLNRSGQQITLSRPVQFYVQQPSILHKP